jgi:hypothetical protein
VLATEALRGVKRTNAVQAICWVCLVVSVPCFYLAVKSPPGLMQIALTIAGFIPIGLFTVAYLYFMFKDPDRLHSEDFQLKSRSLDIIETKSGPMTIGTTSLQNILNPYPQKALPPAEGEENAE